MKRFLTILAVVMTCQMAFCQTYNDLIEQFKGKAGVEYQEVPKMLLSIAAAQADETAKALIAKMDCMKMMDISKTDAETKAAFDAEVKKLADKYTKVLEDAEDGSTSLVMIDGDEENIKAMIMVVSEAGSSQLMVMEGKFKASDMSGLAGMAQ